MRLVSSYSLQEAARGLSAHSGVSGHSGRRRQGCAPGGERESLHRSCFGRVLLPGPRLRPGRYRLSGRSRSGQASFVLADKLEFCRFSYLDTPPAPRAFGVDAGLGSALGQPPSWPGAIRVEMGPLDSDIVRLRPVTVTARIHVNRRPMVRIWRPYKLPRERRERATGCAVAVARALRHRVFAGQHRARRDRAHFDRSGRASQLLSGQPARSSGPSSTSSGAAPILYIAGYAPVLRLPFPTGEVEVEVIPETAKYDINQGARRRT